MDGLASAGEQDQNSLGGNSTDGSFFATSQYVFFGGDIVEEVKLGVGVEDEEELPAVGFDDGHYEVDREEDAALGPLNEIDDLANSFSKMRRFEFAKSVTLIPEPLTIKSSLLTLTLKRPQAKEYFAKAISEMYAEISKADPTEQKL